MIRYCGGRGRFGRVGDAALAEAPRSASVAVVFAYFTSTPRREISLIVEIRDKERVRNRRARRLAIVPFEGVRRERRSIVDLILDSTIARPRSGLYIDERCTRGIYKIVIALDSMSEDRSWWYGPRRRARIPDASGRKAHLVSSFFFLSCLPIIYSVYSKFTKSTRLPSVSFVNP